MPSSAGKNNILGIPLRERILLQGMKTQKHLSPFATVCLCPDNSD